LAHITHRHEVVRWKRCCCTLSKTSCHNICIFFTESPSFYCSAAKTWQTREL